LITYVDVALGMRDRRNWSCDASVVVVDVASRRGVGDLALVLALASLVFSAWSGVGTSAAAATGIVSPRPRESSASQQHDMGTEKVETTLPLSPGCCLTFYLSFHHISNQNLPPRSCVLSEIVRAVPRDSGSWQWWAEAARRAIELSGF